MEITRTAGDLAQPASAAGNGDGHAVLRRVFSRAATALYRFILLRVGGDCHAADDLLQQVCLEAVRHRRPPSDAAECEAWLRGIARNLLRRHWRRLKRGPGTLPLENKALSERLADDLESHPVPPEALIRQEATGQLLLAISTLSAGDQELIFTHYIDGRPQAAIARDLGVTEKSVESRLFRARARLRAVLRGGERSGEP